ncbi:hypothetical protein CDD83_10401 [Cordyceps sp. RAO-2017]|nr:hypothetical protein CDD83_10401 [Cordyceps sp. RAO-2017]
MATLNARLSASPAGQIQRFQVKMERDYVLLLLNDGTTLGCLRGNMTRALEPLLKREQLTFEAVAPLHALRQKILSAGRPSDAVAHIDINIYGPLSSARELGDFLSSHKIWLQRPDYHDRSFAYENPHAIRFPEIEDALPLQELRQEMSTEQRRLENDVLQLVSEVQDSTHRADCLERLTGDRRLQTQLLEHQERALSFMAQRESGDIPDEFRLWEPAAVDGREMFVHRITKTRCAIRPEEKGGGILADEMGMGKSLSVLALIIKTIEEGHAWAQRSRDEEFLHDGVKEYTHSTLVIVPFALLINSWMAEIKTHLADAVNVVKYHGQRRERDLAALARSDIVLTTYKTLATDAASKKDPLHQIGWFRVVLDEAHSIRRPNTTFHRACANLSTRSRWCLTGTPIQNGLEDIGALFMFLRAEPFHSMAQFRRFLVVPFEQRDPIAKTRLVILYDSLVLRRTKDILDLPGQHERIRQLRLSPPEAKQYRHTSNILNRYIRQQVGEREMRRKFGLFQAHLQLRILCNHGTHQKFFSWKRRRLQDEKEAFVAELGFNAERHCAVCRQPRPIINFSNAHNDFVQNCAHVLCTECLEDHDSSRVGPGPLRHCPLCQNFGNSLRDAARDADADATMHNDDEYDETADAYFQPVGHSTKMEALTKDLQEALGETVRVDGRIKKTKSIVFSCWTRTLDLVGKYLKEANIEFLRVDGDCLLSKRQRILDQFSNDGGPRVMLMTTGTGAFGLNLTAANRIFIVELQWNPSVERQAIARAIRIRQKDKVVITRYMVLDTVEQEMQSQQINKRRAAQAGFVNHPEGT